MSGVRVWNEWGGTGVGVVERVSLLLGPDRVRRLHASSGRSYALKPLESHTDSASTARARASSTRLTASGSGPRARGGTLRRVPVIVRAGGGLGDRVPGTSPSRTAAVQNFEHHACMGLRQTVHTQPAQRPMCACNHWCRTVLCKAGSGRPVVSPGAWQALGVCICKPCWRLWNGMAAGLATCWEAGQAESGSDPSACADIN